VPAECARLYIYSGRVTDLTVILNVFHDYNLVFILIFAVFKALAYTTLDKLLAVFFYTIFINSEQGRQVVLNMMIACWRADSLC